MQWGDRAVHHLPPPPTQGRLEGVTWANPFAVRSTLKYLRCPPPVLKREAEQSFFMRKGPRQQCFGCLHIIRLPISLK